MFKLSPITQKRLKRFRSIKRGYYSLIILCSLIFISLFAEFIMNNKPILVRYGSSFYFPIFKFYSSTTFGIDDDAEPDYRLLKKQFKEKGSGFILMPPIPYGPYEYDFKPDSLPPHPPSRVHLLGTDDRGRDVLVRLFYGFRIAIVFSLLLTISGYIIGITIGSFMGYFGGWFDLIVQRFIEIWSTTPFLYLCIIMASIFEPTFVILLLILLLFSWIGITYYMRTEVYREKAKDYCFAAKSIGASNLRVVFKHLVPNSLVPVISFFPFSIVAGISTLTSLDFLGYGLPAPTPSWGELLLQGKQHLHHAYWIPVSTFFAIVITLLLITYIGEAMREAFDPKQYSKYQ